MIVRFANSMLVAQAVLNVLVLLLENDDSTDGQKATIESYQNGREQGYTVAVYTSYPTCSVSIAMYRRSDQIVVYPNNRAMQGLDEDSWNKAEYFGHDEYQKAAEWCFNHLTTPVKEEV